VGRPERPPRGERSALSGSYAAIRGHRSDSARTVIGSVRPARRFDAHRVLAGPGLLSRLAPDRGPPFAFALLQRSIAAPPHRPAGPKTRTSDDASSPGLSCPTTHAERRTRISRGFRPRCVPRPGFGYPHRGVHRRPSRRLAAPERPWASPFKAFSSRRSALLPERPALLAFSASIRLTPMGSVRTRPRSGFRSRHELVLPFRVPKDPARRCLPGFHPSRAFTLLGLHHRFGSRGIPPHALGGSTSRPACVSRSSGSRRSAFPSRGCRLSWVSSPFDRHGTAGIGAGGGLMLSPHGSCALQAARTDLSPLTSPTRPRLSPRPGAAVHR